MAKKRRNKKVNVGRFLPLREVDITCSSNGNRLNLQLVLWNKADLLHATNVIAQLVQTIHKG